VVTEVVKEGYNTNYAATWFLTRGANRFSGFETDQVYTRGNQRDLSGGYAGVPVRLVEKSFVATSAIPFLGDAAPADIHEGILRDDLGGELQPGARLCEAASDGPGELIEGTTIEHLIQRLSTASNNDEYAMLDGGAVSVRELLINDVLPLPDEEGFGGVDFNNDGETEANAHEEVGTYGGDDGRLFLQDYRDFNAFHGSGKNRALNMLFADSSVKTLYDVNGDGYLNQGFPLDAEDEHGDAEHESSFGILNNRCEVGPATLWSGPYLDDSVIKKDKFE
jgi:hypothetical protein